MSNQSDEKTIIIEDEGNHLDHMTDDERQTYLEAKLRMIPGLGTPDSKTRKTITQKNKDFK